MPTFQKVKIRDIAKINPDLIGRDFKHETIEYVDISSVGVGNLAQTQEMDIKNAPSRAKRLVESGDTILSTVRPNRRSFFYFRNPKENTVVSTGFAVLRALKDNDPRYLYYSVTDKSFTDYLTKNAKGSAYPAVDADIIYDGEVFIPENIEIQTHIASVLSAYDDLIENNEKRIKALEQMAQLLYTEWFVKFEFPTALCHPEAPAEGSQGYQSSGGKLIDSGTEYGKIPNGWEVKKLSEVASFVRGRSYSSEQISNAKGEYYIVNLKSFNRGGGFRFDGEKYYTGPINNDQILKRGDVVVAVTDMTNDRAVIARPARVPRIATHKITLSADVVKIISNKLPNSFIYYCLMSHHFTEATKQKANGANVLHLKPAAILEYQTVIPLAGLLQIFNEKCKGILELIDVCMEKNQLLSKTRDLLIPQLVTGKKELK